MSRKLTPAEQEALRTVGGRMRNLAEVARDIQQAWPKVKPHAQPYLEAMLQMEDVRGCYGNETAEEAVRDFLNNARRFTGPQALILKAELQVMLERYVILQSDENEDWLHRGRR